MRNVVLLLLCFLPSCSSGGGFFAGRSSLEVHSMGLKRVVLYANCPTMVCTKGFANEGDIWLTDIPLETLQSGDIQQGQIIHLQVLWAPMAGKTPLVPTSTNLTISHIIIADGEVGVYGGGGYCWPSGHPETGMNLYIEEATLGIQKSSAGFVDLLKSATMTGRVSSQPNQKLARQVAMAAELIVP